MTEEAVSSGTAAAASSVEPTLEPAPETASIASRDDDVAISGDSPPAADEGNNNIDVEDDSKIPFTAPSPPPDDDGDKNDAVVDPSKKSISSSSTSQVAQPSASSSKIDFVDHFSIGRPSSSIRFRKQRVQMYDLNNQQQILLKQQQQYDDNGNNKQGNNNNNNNHTITVQRFETASFGSRFLRLSYSIVTFLMLCFLLAFCLQVIIFLFLNMASTPSGEIKVGYIIAVALSIPLFLYGMASLMALGAAFLRDTFMGNPLFRQLVGGIRPIIMESICLVFFIVIPGLTAAITLLSKSELWWEITAWTWIVCDLILFSAFCLCVVFCEVKTTIELLPIVLQKQQQQLQNSSISQYDQSQPLTVERVLKESILITQTMCYSGYRKQQYLIDTQGNKRLIKSTESLYARLTKLSCWANKGQKQKQDDDYDGNNNNEPVSSSSPPSGGFKVFQVFDTPVRSYEPDEIRDRLPFFGAQNWSLEQVFCRDPRAAAVFIQQGPGKLRHRQVVCTLICTVSGALLVLLLIAGILVFMDVAVVGAILFPLFIIGCCVLPVIIPWVRLYKLYGTPQEENRRQQWANGGKKQSIMMAFAKAEDDNDIEESSSPAEQVVLGNGDDTEGCERNNDETVYQIAETVRISQPNEWFCWCAFGFSIIVFFLWPMIDLFARANTPIAIVFIVFGVFSGPRLYLNPTPILRQLGSLSNIDLPVDDVAFAQEGRVTETATSNRNTNTDGTQPQNSVSSSPSIVVNHMLLNDTETKNEALLRKRARLSRIVGDLNNRARTACWMWTYAILIGIVGIFVLSAFYQAAIGFDYRVKFEYDSFADGFYYPPQPHLPYPTCRMGKDFDFGIDDDGTQLMDIAFMATMGFAGPDEATGLLDQWFGEGFVVDEYEFVDEYRAGLEARGIKDTKVSFKLFTLPSVPGLGVVSIRGSESLLDWCIDVQLWLGAGLAQIIRSIVPVGWIFTPILDDLVFLINSVQTQFLKEVAYYRTTTQFVNDMLDGYADSRFTTMRVTGASLGGGLAIITGAQTNASTVAVSGLNAMLSRHTFDPPLTEEALNTHVMNVIPDRDPISHVDDPGRLFQRTECRAPINSIMGCHSMWRNVCELAYQCGSNGRPILCWCVSRYGYPEPVQNGNQTWAEACPPEAQ